jgi:hypothetical protein
VVDYFALPRSHHQFPGTLLGRRQNEPADLSSLHEGGRPCAIGSRLAVYLRLLRSLLSSKNAKSLDKARHPLQGHNPIPHMPANLIDMIPPRRKVADGLPHVGHQQKSASDKFLFLVIHRTFASDSRPPITRSRSQTWARAAKNDDMPQAIAMTGAEGRWSCTCRCG